MNRRAQHFTRGGQIALHNLRMLYQINKAMLFVYLIMFALISISLIFIKTPKDYLIQTCYLSVAKVFVAFKYKYTFHVPSNGQTLSITTTNLAINPYFQMISAYSMQKATECMKLSLEITLSFAALISCYFVSKGRSQAKNRLIRGSRFKKASKLKRDIIKNGKASDIKIDGFPLIKDSEVQHILVHGTIGTGKSQLIMKILTAIKKRGDRAIIYDKGCNFIQNFYDKAQDVILNPFDARAANWDLLSDAPNDLDLENIAEALFPIEGDSDPFWVNAARLVFVAAISKMRKDYSFTKLIEILTQSSLSDLEEYLKDTQAAQLITSKAEKTASSIRAIIATYIKPLELLANTNGDKFSIRDYLTDDKSKGWLFISSNGAQHKSLKPLISMWLSQASLNILSLKPSSKRRIWLIADELPSLHKLPFLAETIAEARKFGGCFLLGMQNFAQLEKVYKKSGAQEIFDLLNTRFFFRSPSADMAKIVERELGVADVAESKEQYSYGANSIRDGISNSFERRLNQVVLYPELLELPNLTCFLRLPGKYPITKLSINYVSPQEINQGFIETNKKPIAATKDATLIECEKQISKDLIYEYMD